jgi:hypothetical protein
VGKASSRVPRKFFSLAVVAGDAGIFICELPLPRIWIASEVKYLEYVYSNIGNKEYW